MARHKRVMHQFDKAVKKQSKAKQKKYRMPEESRRRYYDRKREIEFRPWTQAILLREELND